MSILEDSKIIALFNERSQKAIEKLSEKYGKTAIRISENILKNKEDAEECVNDAYLGLWNSIPPQSPQPLSTYFYRTVRNQALKKYHSNTAQKRNSYYDSALSELENILSSGNTTEDEIQLRELVDKINRFLENTEKTDRIIFVRRYYFGDSVNEIADILGKSPHYASVRLSRTREKLKEYLRKEDLL